MQYSTRLIQGNSYQINLIPDTQDEHQLIQNANDEYLELYYHKAVETTLGNNASLLSIINDHLKPYSIIGEIQISKGIGS